MSSAVTVEQPSCGMMPVMGQRGVLAASVLVSMLASSAPALAAGGHHAVDDAALLEPGQCQLETWWDRESGGARSLLHAGSACRLRAVDLGLSLERVRVDSTGPSTVAGAQVKWTRAISDDWSAGAVLALAAHDRSPRFPGSTIVVPVTWQASETLLAHLNLGRDFRHHGPDKQRAGLALEWAPLSAWSLVAERFSEGGASFWRLGTRWTITLQSSLDLSRARSRDAGAASWWTLGYTWVFER